MDTDYENFAYVYSGAKKGCICGGYQYVWILTRKPLTKDSDEQKQVYERAKEFCNKNLEDFDFDEEMRYTLQGDDTPGAVYFNDEQQLKPPKELIGKEVTPFSRDK